MALLSVPTLREVSLEASARLLLTACENIEKQNGDYGRLRCMGAVKILKQILMTKLGWVINDVYTKAHELLYTSTLRDVRILFSVGMQKYTKTFTFINEVIFVNLDVDFRFWGRTLGMLINVTHIDIRQLYCSDVMINVICDNCWHLEVFQFSSYYNHNRAIVCPYALKRLLELRKLRIFHDSCAFVDYPEAFLKSFFRQLLPRLENFQHKYFEDFIENVSGGKCLQLTHLWLSNQSQHNTVKALSLCPKLQHLRLRGSLYPGIFDDLTNFAPKLTSFQVDNLSTDCVPGLSHFLIHKGKKLVTLSISTDAVLTINEILLFGECCPQLKEFRLILKYHVITTHTFSNTMIEVSVPIFENLNSLALSANSGTKLDHRIITFFLNHGAKLQFLSLTGSWIKLFEVIRSKSYENCDIFPNLTKLELSVKLSDSLNNYAVPLTHSLFNKCSNLKFFHLYSSSKFYDSIDNFLTYDSTTGLQLDKDVVKRIKYMNTMVVLYSKVMLISFKELYQNWAFSLHE